MSPKALVVEDEPTTVSEIENSLCSLGHGYMWASNLQDARVALAENQFDYVLLDLEFPTKPSPRVSFALKENGGLLLEEIQQAKGFKQLPVIIMSGHVAYCLNQTNEFIDKGATDFIAKPFPTEGRTLARVIRSVLRKQTQSTATTTGARFERFAGGDLAYFDDRVELLGVKIISDRGAGLTIQILDALRARYRDGRYIPISAEELAKLLGVPDVNTITGCIRGLRRNIANRLRKYRNIEIEPNEVICRDEQGYYLLPWIAVQHGDETPIACHAPAPVPTDVLTTSTDVPAVSAVELNERQQWALHQLVIGVRLQRAMLEDKFGVVEKTAKRDLTDLSRHGKIEYVRFGRKGYYRLAVAQPQAQKAS